jgi:hypothetical protein
LKLFEVLEGAHGCLSKGVLVLDVGYSDILLVKSESVERLGSNAASES